MISRTTYDLILRGFSVFQNEYEGTSGAPSLNDAQIMQDWKHPYVVVVQRTAGRGYYLDRNYGHITSVQDIDVPTKWVERELNHQASSFTTPYWALATHNDQFDSYWLY